jgi:hypothetical protein
MPGGGRRTHDFPHGRPFFLTFIEIAFAILLIISAVSFGFQSWRSAAPTLALFVAYGVNESPSHGGELADGLPGILADRQNGLGGSDVVAGTPLAVLGDCAEIFLNQLRSPRQFVPSTHTDDYRRVCAAVYPSKAQHALRSRASWSSV